MLRSLRSMRELQPWSAPLLLPHLHRSVHIFHLHIQTLLCSTLCVKFTMFLSRLYEKHGEAAVRSFSQFYPTVTPGDVMAMAQKSHFLAYLDNLVQSQPEEHRYLLDSTSFNRLWIWWHFFELTWIISHRLPFLQSLLEPESLRQDWLVLALTHDAPQCCDTQTPDGKPRSESQRSKHLK